jgi:hypothetical protein
MKSSRQCFQAVSEEGQNVTGFRRLMKRVLERDEWRCQKCGALENLQVHHRIKGIQLGNDSLDNRATLRAHGHERERRRKLIRLVQQEVPYPVRVRPCQFLLSRKMTRAQRRPRRRRDFMTRS